MDEIKKKIISNIIPFKHKKNLENSIVRTVIGKEEAEKGKNISVMSNLLSFFFSNYKRKVGK